MFFNTLTKKNRSLLQKNIFLSSGIINLLFDGLAYITRADILRIARIFPRPRGAQKNTTQLAKYLHVLYARPSNELCVFTIEMGEILNFVMNISLIIIID